MQIRFFQWNWAIAILFLAGSSLFPSPVRAQLETCIGPENTMETPEFASMSGPLVSIEYWSQAEQDFLVDYQQQFLSQCMGISTMAESDFRSGSYERDGFQDLIDRTRRICKGDTGGYGTNWDRFIANLPSFSALCQQTSQ
ncbi:MAG: hypothetical protein VKL39_16885 [Leptolyngbyaceae bacterium]|nr:hypothetical protein [Leptolyngbyaceae bacterium]